MWFAYTDNYSNWHMLKIEQVREIVAENKERRRVSALEDFSVEIAPEPEKNYNNAMGQESLTRFDQPKKKKRPTKKKKAGEDKEGVAVAREAGTPAIVAKKNGPKAEGQPKKAANPANKDANREPKAPKARIKIIPNKKDDSKE